MKNFKNFFASLVAVFVLALAFTAFSPAVTNAATENVATNIVNPFTECPVTTYVYDQLTNQPVTNYYAQGSSDGGLSWFTLGHSGNTAYVVGGLPTSYNTQWTMRILRQTKRYRFYETYSNLENIVITCAGTESYYYSFVRYDVG